MKNIYVYFRYDIYIYRYIYIYIYIYMSLIYLSIYIYIHIYIHIYIYIHVENRLNFDSPRFRNNIVIVPKPFIRSPNNQNTSISGQQDLVIYIYTHTSPKPQQPFGRACVCRLPRCHSMRHQRRGWRYKYIYIYVYMYIFNTEKMSKTHAIIKSKYTLLDTAG